MATIDGGTGFQFPLSMSTGGADLTVYEEQPCDKAITEYTVVGTTPKIPYKQYSAKVTVSQMEMYKHKSGKGYLEHVLEGVKKQVLEQMNQDICFLGLTSSKTGSAHDPVTGEGYSVGVASTQWDLTNPSSSEPYYMQPLTSSSAPLDYKTLEKAYLDCTKSGNLPNTVVVPEGWLTDLTAWAEMPKWTYDLSPSEPDLSWKLSAGAGEHPSGSSKRKATRKDTFKNGIL